MLDLSFVQLNNNEILHDENGLFAVACRARSRCRITTQGLFYCIDDHILPFHHRIHLYVELLWTTYIWNSVAARNLLLNCLKDKDQLLSQNILDITLAISSIESRTVDQFTCRQICAIYHYRKFSFETAWEDLLNLGACPLYTGSHPAFNFTECALISVTQNLAWHSTLARRIIDQHPEVFQIFRELNLPELHSKSLRMLTPDTFITLMRLWPRTVLSLNYQWSPAPDELPLAPIFHQEAKKIRDHQSSNAFRPFWYSRFAQENVTHQKPARFAVLGSTSPESEVKLFVYRLWMIVQTVPLELAFQAKATWSSLLTLVTSDSTPLWKHIEEVVLEICRLAHPGGLECKISMWCSTSGSLQSCIINVLQLLSWVGSVDLIVKLADAHSSVVKDQINMEAYGVPSPLQCAIIAHNEDCIKYLLEQGADPNEIRCGSCYHHPFAKYHLQIKHNYLTPLICAVDTGFLPIARLL